MSLSFRSPSFSPRALQGKHYGVPGLLVDGQDVGQTLKGGRAVVDYVRFNGPAILQVHTFRFQGHSPADPEHERGRKEEKAWARKEADPIALFETKALAEGIMSQDEVRGDGGGGAQQRRRRHTKISH